MHACMHGKYKRFKVHADAQAIYLLSLLYFLSYLHVELDLRPQSYVSAVVVMLVLQHSYCQ